jgi:hypothetical protein
MGFTWACYDADSNDLFEDFGIQLQALNLGPNSQEDTPAPFRVSDIRAMWKNWPFASTHVESAQDLLRTVQTMAYANLLSLHSVPHCETCTCNLSNVEPTGWSTTEIKRFIAIPVHRVVRCQSSY